MGTPFTSNPPSSTAPQRPSVKGLTELCGDVFIRSLWLGWLGKPFLGLKPITSLGRFLSERTWLDILAGTFVLWLCSGLVFSFFDPFGLSTTSDAYSQLIIDRVTAPFYRSPGQDRIAVVLIDDATLDQMEVGWPPPYDVYATLLYRILRQHPKAVFLDIMLERIRNRDRAALERARSTLSRIIPRFNIPVVLARSNPKAVNLFQGIPGVKTAMVAWASSEYPLWDKDSNRPTVAPVLYSDLCADDPGGGLDCSGAPAPTPANPMAVQWGCAVSETMRDRDLLPSERPDTPPTMWQRFCRFIGLLPTSDLFVAPTGWQRLGRSAGLLFQSLRAGSDSHAIEESRERIPYTVTVMAHDLGKPQVRDLLKDRAVLVGVSLHGSNDLVNTPANGQLPGVYYHAMALDNLTRYGSNYFVNPPPSLLSFMAICLLMSALSSFMYLRRNKLGALYLLASYSIIFGLMFILYYFLRIAPQNWIGYFMLATLAKSIQTPDRTPKAPESKECIQCPD